MKTPELLLIVISISLAACSPVPKEYQVMQYYLHPAVQKFREYLQIDTSMEENLKYAVAFWRRQAQELDLPFAVHTSTGKPVCVITWLGADPTLPSIVLNSHMDVVAVDAEDWTHPPFDAYIDENGDIFARGAQDTKDVAIQYIEAIRCLKNENVTLLRTVHVTLMPDEESGGHNGMRQFVDSEEFKALNVGFALDEGIASEDDTLYATYADKRPWQMKFTVHGTATHGSRMPDNSAMEKLRRLIDSISEYRNSQRTIQNTGGAYNNLNINIIDGGLAPNIVPSKMSLVVDMRLTPSANATEMEQIVTSWANASGDDTTLEFIRRFNDYAVTPIDRNPFWDALRDAAANMGYEVQPTVCPATSDMMYVRNRGIPALGLSFKPYTTTRMHGANEYINAGTFLHGVGFYGDIIRSLGNTL